MHVQQAGRQEGIATLDVVAIGTRNEGARSARRRGRPADVARRIAVSGVARPKGRRSEPG